MTKTDLTIILLLFGVGISTGAAAFVMNPNVLNRFGSGDSASHASAPTQSEKVSKSESQKVAESSDDKNTDADKEENSVQQFTDEEQSALLERMKEQDAEAFYIVAQNFYDPKINDGTKSATEAFPLYFLSVELGHKPAANDFKRLVEQLNPREVHDGIQQISAIRVGLKIPEADTVLEKGLDAQTDARNAQRRSDVNTILNASYQYAIDNNGNLPAGIPEGDKDAALEVCRSDAENCDGLIDLHTPLSGSYLVSVPVDPQQSDTANPSTRYAMYKEPSGRLTVFSLDAEGDAISVTR